MKYVSETVVLMTENVIYLMDICWARLGILSCVGLS